VDEIKKQELQDMKEQVRKAQGEEHENLQKAISVVVC
jgi:hypothetical protein